MRDEILDVAIIGGGVAGTYAAWRLLQRGVGEAPRKVALFEGSDRIGGRLLSVKPPGMEHLVCELGGMYFVNLHPLVCSLVKKLGLAVQSVPQASRDLFYLRRERFLKDLSKVPYNFAPGERTGSPDDLLARALDKLIPGIMKLRGKQLDLALRTAVVDGHHIADWGFWNLLYLGMSSEAFDYTRDSTPDDYLLMNWNAADAIRALQLFGPATQVFHLTDGYDGLPHALCDEVRNAGAQVHMRHRLKSLDIVDDGLVRLHLDRDSEGWGASGKGEPMTVLARKVILAMPRRALEILEQTGPIFENASVQKMLGTVTTIPMFKMFSCYAAPWWQELGFATNGIAVTDMPLRVCLYWGTEGEQQGGDPSNKNSLLLTTLNDLMTASFWAGLRDPKHAPLFAQQTNAPLHGHPGSPEWQRYSDCTTQRLVTEAQRQLSEVHGIKVPEPYAAASMNWSADPFGGAASFWNVHARSEEVMAKMTQPVDGLPIYICGESFARSQGWVEGALETSELMLEKHFGLTRPSWLVDETPPKATP